MNRMLSILLILSVSSCSTAASKRNVSMQEPESAAEAGSAMGAVVGSVTGQPIGEQELRRLGQQIRRDPEAQSAVESITGAVGDPATSGKYCPVDGERYSSKFTECLKHRVLLKNIEE